MPYDALPRLDMPNDKTAVSQPSKTIKPKKFGSGLEFPLYDLFGDYFDSTPAAVTGGAIDATILLANKLPPARPVTLPLLGITRALNTVPKFSFDKEGLHYDEDYWKKKGKEDRSYHAEQMNKAKEDLHSTFIRPPLPYIDD